MFKRLGKKVLTVIMATMLVASMSAVSTFAVDTDTKESKVISKAQASTYTDKNSGVKLESDSLTLNQDTTFVFTAYDKFIPKTDLYEKILDIEVYSSADGLEMADLSKTPVTAYIPHSEKGCYVIFSEYETSELTQLKAEYVDGCYKVEMKGSGTYIICDYPLAEGEGKLVQQTLVDKKTGVSVSGMIPTDSKLVVLDIDELYDTMVDDNGSAEQTPISMAEKYDGYSVHIVRNLEEIEIKDELTFTIPYDKKGYELRCIGDKPMTDEELYEMDNLGMELIDPNGIPAEELAEKLTVFMNKQYPALESKYVDGSYVVKNNYTGYYLFGEAGSFAVTVDEVNEIRAESNAGEDEFEEPTDAPTEAPTEVTTQAPTQAPTEAPTQAPTQVATQAPTQAPTQVATQVPTQAATQKATQASTQAATNATTSTTQGKGTATTGDSRNIPMLLALMGTATATIVAFRKRIAK